MALVYKIIANDDDTILLSDLYDIENNKYYEEPSLQFKEAITETFWGNSIYVFNFLRGIKKNKEEQILELELFYKDNKLDFKQTKEDLIDIYNHSKLHKMFAQLKNN